jgi:hypothetical protein
VSMTQARNVTATFTLTPTRGGGGGCTLRPGTTMDDLDLTLVSLLVLRAVWRTLDRGRWRRGQQGDAARPEPSRACHASAPAGEQHGPVGRRGGRRHEQGPRSHVAVSALMLLRQQSAELSTAGTPMLARFARCPAAPRGRKVTKRECHPCWPAYGDTPDDLGRPAQCRRI